jgi:C_GCAxxG_C_C family probable redox protein
MSAASVKRAAELFGGGSNCAQAVLGAYAGDYGLPLDTAMTLASGLGGGIGRSGATCGAVLGACLVLGLASGRVADAWDSEGRLLAAGKVRAFLDEFDRRCGSTTCSGLLGYEVGTVDGRAAAVSSGVMKRLCPGFVNSAAELLEEMLVN